MRAKLHINIQKYCIITGSHLRFKKVRHMKTNNHACESAAEIRKSDRGWQSTTESFLVFLFWEPTKRGVRYVQSEWRMPHRSEQFEESQGGSRPNWPIRSCVPLSVSVDALASVPKEVPDGVLTRRSHFSYSVPRRQPIKWNARKLNPWLRSAIHRVEYDRGSNETSVYTNIWRHFIGRRTSDRSQYRTLARWRCPLRIRFKWHFRGTSISLTHSRTYTNKAPFGPNFARANHIS